VRLLLIADTHLGFDLPVRPRVARRRRGHDFIANYRAALAPALAGDGSWLRGVDRMLGCTTTRERVRAFDDLSRAWPGGAGRAVASIRLAAVGQAVRNRRWTEAVRLSAGVGPSSAVHAVAGEVRRRRVPDRVLVPPGKEGAAGRVDPAGPRSSWR